MVVVVVVLVMVTIMAINGRTTAETIPQSNRLIGAKKRKCRRRRVLKIQVGAIVRCRSASFIRNEM